MIDLNRKLPIGIQTFEKIRKENYLYVDKTALVGKMVSTSTPISLAVPDASKKPADFYFRGLLSRT